MTVPSVYVLPKKIGPSYVKSFGFWRSTISVLYSKEIRLRLTKKVRLPKGIAFP